MNKNSQFQNPNHHTDDPITNNDLSLYSDIVNFLMSDEDDGHSSSSTVTGSSTTSIKSKRGLKNYEAGEDIRYAFRTKTNIEFMDDGYKWRKYGKKRVKNSPNPRNYFKCSSGGCTVKKRVEKDREDPSYVITTYQGKHNHETPNCVPYYSQQPSSILRSSSSI